MNALDTIINLSLLALLFTALAEAILLAAKRRRAVRVRYLSVIGFLSDPEKPASEYVRNRYQLMVYTEKRAGLMPWRVAS